MKSQIMQEVHQSGVGSSSFDGKYCSKEYFFISDFIGFQGHFPGNPVLPAVVQFNVALDVLQEVLGQELQIDSINKAKFNSVLKSDMTIKVLCRIEDLNDESLSVFCQLSASYGQASSFKLNLSR